MNHIDLAFDQPVLYQGIQISCKSLFGYHYKLKNSQQEESYTSNEYLVAFVEELNKTVRKNSICLRIVDILALLIILTFSVLSFVFSPSLVDHQIPYVIFVILVVSACILFIILKFKSLSCLNKKLEKFLELKNPGLLKIGLRGILIKPKLYDRAPSVFLNVIPAKNAFGFLQPRKSDSESNELKEDLYGHSPISRVSEEEFKVQKNNQPDDIEASKLNNENFSDIEENKIVIQLGKDQKVQPSKL